MNRLYDKAVFISWMKEVPRSKGIAEALGIRDFYIERMKSAPRWLVPLRYLLQTVKTLGVLWRQRPRLIIAMNPPIILPLLAYLAARFLNAEFVIDSHTGAFDGGWARYLFLHRFLSRRALATLVTNEPLRARVEGWGAKALILEDRVPEIPQTAPSGRFTVGVISSFAPDEPIDAIIDAARDTSEFSFLITGQVPAAFAKHLRHTPENVRFTGYLPRTEYVSLLHRVDALMVLVKRDLTLLCGAYEAVAVGKPLITSDWPVLRNYFNLGAIYVDNTPGSIRDAVRRVARCREQLTVEMQQLRNSLEQHWNGRFKVLRSHLNRVLATGVTEDGEEVGPMIADGASARAISSASYSENSAEVTVADR